MKVPWSLPTPQFVFDPKRFQRSFDDFEDVVLLAHLGDQDVAGTDDVLLPFAQDARLPFEDEPVFVGIMKMEVERFGIRHDSDAKPTPLQPIRFVLRPSHNRHLGAPRSDRKREYAYTTRQLLRGHQLIAW